MEGRQMEEYLPLLDLMEGRTMKASELEDILLKVRELSTDIISRRSGVSAQYIRYISQGFHKDEIVSREIIDRLRSVL